MNEKNKLIGASPTGQEIRKLEWLYFLAYDRFRSFNLETKQEAYAWEPDFHYNMTAEEKASFRRVHLKGKYPGGEPCISIVCNGVPYRFATFGNISLVMGPAKSRKTTVCSLIISELLSDRVFTGSISGQRTAFVPDGICMVQLFDTEQSRPDIQDSYLKRIAARAGEPAMLDFEAYTLRNMRPEEKLSFVDETVTRTPGSKFVVIDNARDFVYDFNNAVESVDAVLKLQGLADKGHHVMLVLHVNRTGDGKARGHFGTEIMNRAETVLLVTSKGESSSAVPSYTRGKPFPGFRFGLDVNEVACFIDVDENTLEGPGKKEKKVKALLPKEMPRQDHVKFLVKVYAGKQKLQYRELAELLKVELKNSGLPNGNNKVQEFIRYYVDMTILRLIDKGVSGNKFTLYMFIP